MKISEEQFLVLERAIRKFGVLPQLDMVIEECAELIQAINKAKRVGLVDGLCFSEKKTNEQLFIYNNLCNEVADVRVMIEQIELMLNGAAIQICFNNKIKRLNERLNKII
jgi:NTP pyrophosphatase (non-canonical NTP hydrolase)